MVLPWAKNLLSSHAAKQIFPQIDFGTSSLTEKKHFYRDEYSEPSLTNLKG